MAFDITESKDPLKDIVKIIEADKLETTGFDNQVSFAYYQGLQAIFEDLSPQSNFMKSCVWLRTKRIGNYPWAACSISDRAFTDVRILLNQVKRRTKNELRLAVP